MRIYFSSLSFEGVPLLWEYNKTTPDRGPSVYSAKCLYRTLDGKSLDSNNTHFINQQLQEIFGVQILTNVALIEDLTQFGKRNPYHLANHVYKKSDNQLAPVISLGFFRESPIAPDRITFCSLEAPNKTNCI